MSRVLAAFFWVCFVAVSCWASMKEPEKNIFTGGGAPSLTASRVDTEIYNRPYMVSLEVNFYTPTSHCEAAIVGEEWAITSARCCARLCGRTYPTENVKIRSGSKNENLGGTSHTIDSILFAPGYVLHGIANNLCLLKVNEKFTFGQNTAYIRLADDEDYGHNQQTGEVSGWSNRNNVDSASLHTVTLPLISNNNCKQQYSPSSDITDKLFCGHSTGQATCHGVAGGPLVIDGRLAGVVAAGYGCDTSPGVYTRVSQYKDWIRQHIGEDQQIEEVDPEVDIDRRTLP